MQMQPSLERALALSNVVQVPRVSIPARTSTSGGLTAREREIAGLMADRLSNREIAERLIVAPNTVKAHVRHLGTKLGASSRTQLLARAREAGLL